MNVRSPWTGILLIIATLTGCQLPVTGDQPSTDQVTVAVGNVARTLASSSTEAVDRYLIILYDHPEGLPARVSQIDTGTAASFAGVAAGTWKVEVVALSEAGLVLGAGTGAVTIWAGAGASVQIPLSTTQTRSGGFRFRFSIPAASGIDGVSAQLFDRFGKTVGPSLLPSWTDRGSRREAQLYQPDLPSGSYRLELTFLRGTAAVGMVSQALRVWDGVVAEHWPDAEGKLYAQREFQAADFSSSATALGNLVFHDQGQTQLTLTPEFSSEYLSYQLTSQRLEGASLSLTAVPSLKGQKIEYRVGSGAWLSAKPEGSPRFSVAGGGGVKIRVTSPDGSTNRMYSVSVTAPVAVSYDGNGADGGAVPTNGGSRYQPGALVSVLGNPGLLTKAGSIFTGWNTAANGSGTSYAAGGTFVMTTAPVTLYAVWVAQTMLSFSGSTLTKVSPEYSGALILPAGITAIADRALNAAVGVTRVVVPEGVVSLGESAFAGCTSLVEVVLPTTLVSIGDGAFWNCSALTRIVLPASLRTMGLYVFNGCTSLASVVVEEGVVSLGETTFYGCVNLTAIVLPSTITALKPYVFYGCVRLTSVTLSSTLTAIGDYAFENCSQLTQVISPALVPPVLGSGVFAGTGAGLKILVPELSVAAYRGASGWGDYAAKVSPQR